MIQRALPTSVCVLAIHLKHSMQNKPFIKPPEVNVSTDSLSAEHIQVVHKVRLTLVRFFSAWPGWSGINGPLKTCGGV